MVEVLVLQVWSKMLVERDRLQPMSAKGGFDASTGIYLRLDRDAIAGWLAGLLVKGYGFGLIGNIVVGILGAGVAGLLAPRLGVYTESFGGNIVASLLGALVLLLLIGLVRRT
jgi:uncharacterized membrane protein YeaQ/YmgE (transglycosylase-associated protein family)